MKVAVDNELPRIWAETDRFRRGQPRTFAITDTHVTFLRSAGPLDATLSLWRWDAEADVERCLVDARSLAADDAALPAAERARRERVRESGSGITAYSMSANGERIAFALGGALRLWDSLGIRSVELPGSVVDPRLDPTGEFISCIVEGALQIVRFTDGAVVHSVSRDGVTVGLADFAAAEELQRHRGHWWAPDGGALIAEIVDDANVPQWFISDPTHPDREPMQHRYPHAGATNAHCSLLLIDVLAGTEVGVHWDDTEHEYLVDVHWSRHGAPLVTLANRAQTTFESFVLDPATGGLQSVRVTTCEPWIDVTPGVPAWLPDGRLLHAVNDGTTDTRRLAAGDDFVTPAGFHVAGVTAIGDEHIVVVGSRDPREQHALVIGLTGEVAREIGDVAAWNLVASNGSSHVAVEYAQSGAVTVRVLAGARDALIDNAAARVTLPRPLEFEVLGERECNALIFWPQNATNEPLPIVMAPYGGPHHLEVTNAGIAFADTQWLADQGFAVIVADGRGTPGRGLHWEHAIHRRFAEVTLADQLAVLDAALQRWPDRLDGGRVGIRGWSYGGYLSALAVLAHPDRFHAAVAGAPVSDWRLYDTCYTERYLGHPEDAPEVYESNSLAHLADRLVGDLLIVHGLADDNVVSAHSLQLSAALYAAGKPHTFLPLAGVSHMTPQPRIKENLLRLEADFLRRSLRVR